ncbi:hypothetical protein FJY68_10630 [candidate division WOR-3 bacterium]|uniref:Uncharacterized protein n=1 Tax=candidate division WOR-3 bacterium TaxID=2052148 RepID=A0A937XHS4_UNCW3|nr:hypothetical protein [candidate division WOR-3 bacterium]
MLGRNPLLDYRLPETSARSWSVEIDPDTFVDFGTGERFWLRGAVVPRYDILVVGERKYIAATARLGVSTSVSRSFSISGGPSLDADADWYPSQLPVSIGTNSHLSADLGHSQGPGYWRYDWLHDSVWIPSHNDNSWSVSTEMELGPAFGRLRDATPVLEALLIGEALSKEGLLAAPMGEEVVQGLAGTLAGSSRYYYTHDSNRATKFYYAEIERVLAAAGCIAGRLPARIWLRIREIVGRQPLLGDRYWRTGAKLATRCGIDAGLSRYSRNRGGQREVTEDAYAELSGLATFAFGHPFTTRLHLSGTAEAHHLPHFGHQDASADVVLSYLLPDRMLLSLTGRLQLTRDNLSQTQVPVLSYQGASVGADLLSYVEDRSTLSVGVACDQNGTQSGESASWQRTWGLGLSVSLRHYF